MCWLYKVLQVSIFHLYYWYIFTWKSLMIIIDMFLQAMKVALLTCSDILSTAFWNSGNFYIANTNIQNHQKSWVFSAHNLFSVFSHFIHNGLLGKSGIWKYVLKIPIPLISSQIHFILFTLMGHCIWLLIQRQFSKN